MELGVAALDRVPGESDQADGEGRDANRHSDRLCAWQIEDRRQNDLKDDENFQPSKRAKRRGFYERLGRSAWGIKPAGHWDRSHGSTFTVRETPLHTGLTLRN